MYFSLLLQSQKVLIYQALDGLTKALFRYILLGNPSPDGLVVSQEITGFGSYLFKGIALHGGSYERHHHHQ